MKLCIMLHKPHFGEFMKFLIIMVSFILYSTTIYAESNVTSKNWQNICKEISKNWGARSYYEELFKKMPWQSLDDKKVYEQITNRLMTSVTRVKCKDSVLLFQGSDEALFFKDVDITQKMFLINNKQIFFDISTANSAKDMLATSQKIAGDLFKLKLSIFDLVFPNAYAFEPFLIGAGIFVVAGAVYTAWDYGTTVAEKENCLERYKYTLRNGQIYGANLEQCYKENICKVTCKEKDLWASQIRCCTDARKWAQKESPLYEKYLLENSIQNGSGGGIVIPK